MAYSDFTIESACQAFTLDLNDQGRLFAGIQSVPAGAHLRTSLEEYVPLALAIHTEKARSEFIVAPILVEVRRLMKHRISLFSGVELNVDPARGLNGTCDFILAASPVQHVLRAPVMTIIEAKKDSLKDGMGQCIAAMYAARLFNERQGDGPSTVHGAVTTGSLWSFLKLDSSTVRIDRDEYSLHQLENVLAILLHCVGGDAATEGAAA